MMKRVIILSLSFLIFALLLILYLPNYRNIERSYRYLEIDKRPSMVEVISVKEDVSRNGFSIEWRLDNNKFSRKVNDIPCRMQSANFIHEGYSVESCVIRRNKIKISDHIYDDMTLNFIPNKNYLVVKYDRFEVFSK